MWLLDANMDVHLASVLDDFGIGCDTAANRGWKALRNGELVTAAVAAGFPEFAVVVVNVPQQPWNQYRERLSYCG